MHDSGAIDPHVAGVGEAFETPVPLHDLGQARLNDFACSMGAGRNQQRSVIRRYRIEMDSDRDHSFNQIEGRFDMIDAVFSIPVFEAEDACSLVNGDCSILMPAQTPVGSRVFVEQDGPDRLRANAQPTGYNLTDDTLLAEPRLQRTEIAES
jgi:hypothetical protein